MRRRKLRPNPDLTPAHLAPNPSVLLPSPDPGRAISHPRGVAALCNMSSPRVVIIGGGFGGLTAARTLRAAPVSLTLVDRRNHHVFQPLLYQVATAALSPGDIAYPIRSILRRQKNTEVLLAEVTAIDLARRELRFTGGISSASGTVSSSCSSGRGPTSATSAERD